MSIDTYSLKIIADIKETDRLIEEGNKLLLTTILLKDDDTRIEVIKGLLELSLIRNELCDILKRKFGIVYNA